MFKSEIVAVSVESVVAFEIFGTYSRKTWGVDEVHPTPLPLIGLKMNDFSEDGLRQALMGKAEYS